MISIPLRWIEWVLVFIASSEGLLGIFSFLFPKNSIALYQWLMKNFNWRVEPIDYDRELKTTQKFGIVIVLLCGVMLAALFKPEWFLLARLQAGWLSS